MHTLHQHLALHGPYIKADRLVVLVCTYRHLCVSVHLRVTLHVHLTQVTTGSCESWWIRLAPEARPQQPQATINWLFLHGGCAH